MHAKLYLAIVSKLKAGNMALSATKMHRGGTIVVFELCRPNYDYHQTSINNNRNDDNYYNNNNINKNNNDENEQQ